MVYLEKGIGMGFFKRFARKKNDEEQWLATASIGNVNSVPCVEPNNRSSSSELTLGEVVDRCMYANAKYLGSIAMVIQTREKEGRPNFINLLKDGLGVLAPSLSRFRMIYVMGQNGWIIPEEYRVFFEPGSRTNWSLYIDGCGNVAYAQELKRQGRRLPKRHGVPQLPINWPSQLATLKSTSEMAIAQCLALLKAADKNGEEYFKTIMLDDEPYLFALILFYLMIQINVFQMQYQNGVVFIPNDLLEKPLDIPLKFYEIDVDPDAPCATIPMQLDSLMFIPNESNGDYEVALGQQTIAGREGVVLKTDQSIASYLDLIADNFIEGVRLQLTTRS